MQAGGEAASNAQIADLLAQCSQEDLQSILQTIEGGTEGAATLPQAEAQSRGGSLLIPDRTSCVSRTSCAHSTRAEAGSGAGTPEGLDFYPSENYGESVGERSDKSPVPDGQPALAPVPPAGPAPSGSHGRRPQGRAGAAARAEDGAQAQVTMDELKMLLQEHSAGVMAEVRKLIPVPGPPAVEAPAPPMVPVPPPAPLAPDGTSLDMNTLAQVLAERDEEVKALESRLADLQGDLALKDKRVADLNEALDVTVREVRHRQLDLEFQQLKLEERVRSNAELEQQQRSLTERVEEASLNARHAALDVDMCMSTPRSMRAQGTLPWTLRNKGRLPLLYGAPGGEAATPR